MCVWLVGVFPWCVGVEFVPVDAGSVSGGDAEDLLPSFVAAFPCLSVEVFDLFVAPRMRGQPCGVFGVLGVLVWDSFQSMPVPYLAGMPKTCCLPSSLRSHACR